MPTFTARAPSARACAAPRLRQVQAQGSRRNLAAGLISGVAAATLLAGSPAEARVEAQRLGLFPEMSDKKERGIPSPKSSDDIANAPGGAKDPNQTDAVNKATEKYAYGGGTTGPTGKDPSPKFTAEKAGGKGLDNEGGSFKDIKPDSRT